jgi:hypothetical protein
MQFELAKGMPAQLLVLQATADFKPTQKQHQQAHPMSC